MLFALGLLVACRAVESAPDATAPSPPSATPVARAEPSPCLTRGEWTPWVGGLDVGLFPTRRQSAVGDSLVLIARVDPSLLTMEIRTAGRDKGASRTARGWANTDDDIVAVINAGMYASDLVTHVGELVVDGVSSGRAASGYQSVAEFGPVGEWPGFRLRDLDLPASAPPARYRYRVQNLRLIKKPAENRWREQPRRWSEAALGEDERGRALLIFSRSPYSMHALNDELLHMGLGMVAAQHLEGGPEAQLYLRAGACEFEGFGSYETDFIEDDSNDHAWVVPNVIVARGRP